MKKMEILKINKRLFNIIGITLSDTRPSTAFMAFLINLFCILTMGPFFCGTSFAFIYSHIYELHKCSNAIMLLFGCFMCVNKYSCLKIHQSTILDFITGFQQLIDNKVPKSKRILYQTAETKGRQLTMLILKGIMPANATLFLVVPICMGCFQIAVGNLDTRTWFRPYQIM